MRKFIKFFLPSILFTLSGANFLEAMDAPISNTPNKTSSSNSSPSSSLITEEIKKYIIKHLDDDCNDLKWEAEKLYKTKDKENWKLAAALESIVLAREEPLIQNWFIETFIEQEAPISKNRFTLEQLRNFQQNFFQEEFKELDAFFYAILIESKGDLKSF
jgi:hypothetical protein